MKTDNHILSIRTYQIKEYEDKEINKFIYDMGEFFNKKIFKEELNTPLKKFVLNIKYLKWGKLGTYQRKDGIGFSNIITINSNIIFYKNLTYISAILLHEMYHEYQALYDPRQTKTKGYHDKRFLQLSQKYVPTNNKGHFLGITEEFIDTIKRSNLIEHIHEDLLLSNIDLEKNLISPKKKSKQTTRMQKWKCSCVVIVRCAVELNAVCQKCNKKFIQETL